MASKVGLLDNPQLYDARSKAVYARTAGGFFFLLDGARIAVGGTQRWTTNDGIAMRGNVLHMPTSEDNAFSDGEQALDTVEEEELAMAIAASLAEDGEVCGEQDVTMPGGARTSEALQASTEPRRCVVCLDDDAPVNHMIAPCHHLCLCPGCAARVRRQRVPCPVCRRAQRNIVRVFF